MTNPPPAPRRSPDAVPVRGKRPVEPLLVWAFLSGPISVTCLGAWKAAVMILVVNIASVALYRIWHRSHQDAAHRPPNSASTSAAVSGRQ